jgi:hypothetical protein
VPKIQWQSGPRQRWKLLRITCGRFKPLSDWWGEMTDDNFTVSREQAREIFKALAGIGNLVKNLGSKSGNAAEVYAIMQNLAVIQANLVGMPRENSN